ncbi:glycosyltransferase [Pigmentibacter ruber]
MSKVSIGIVVYNTKKEVIERTLSSIKKYCNADVYILCNSNDSEYRSYLRHICENFEYNFLVSEKNLGFGAGHNEIVSKITTDWYICCNPDITFYSNFVDEFVLEAEKIPDSIILTIKILNPDGSIQKLSRKHITLFNWIHRQLWRIFPKLFSPFEVKFNYMETQEIEFVTGCFFLIKKENYLKLNGFCQEYFLYCEDADISRRASLYGKNYYLSNYSVYHDWGKAYTKSFKALKIELKSLYKYFKKFGLFNKKYKKV